MNESNLFSKIRTLVWLQAWGKEGLDLQSFPHAALEFFLNKSNYMFHKI